MPRWSSTRETEYEQKERRILIGSSTELNEAVPLANFLALREAVLEQ
jgi:hypothetical protein